MPVTTKTLTKARREIETVLSRYRLDWEDIAPDADEAIWRKFASAARRVRRELFRERYPSLYDALRTGKR